ncbi:MAG: nitroreductase family protein [Clostridiales Family XIII bacterium]|jgi:nitroreductase|nr:nitroreductase family protein [Clostridiales Family XIII bacterium]
MDTLQALKTRRSVRRFQAGQVDAGALDRALEAATYAPTGMGRQAPQLVVVQDAQTLDQLRKMNMEVLGGGKDPYYGAPTIVLALAPEDVNTYVEDASCVLTYLMLALHEEGVASVWVHREREMFASAEGKALLKKWGIPEKYQGVGSLAVGYAEGDYPQAAPRREGYVLKV